MSKQFKLIIKNNSALTRDVCILQKNPDHLLSQNLHSLAWFSKSCQRNTEPILDWCSSYNLTSNETGILTPDVSNTSKVMSADLKTHSKNNAGLDRNKKI